MRLAISNIAWDVEEDEQVAVLLNQHGIDAIDIAPGKYFPEPSKASDEDIAKVKAWWSDKGIEITGMQSLLFGTTGLNVFGTSESQQALLDHLDAVCRIASGLRSPRLVFGSPKNRDRSGLTDDAADQAAVAFFRRLGNIAQSHGVMICLEPNPPVYGCNFMTTSAETGRIVGLVDHPAIRMQLDTGAVTINSEDVFEVVNDNAALIGHVHASEPQLKPVGDGGTDHAAAAAALAAKLPRHIVSIEMVATKDEPHLQAIERAVKVAIHDYRGAGDCRAT